MKKNPGIDSRSKEKQFHFEYHWVIVAICFLVVMLTWGFCSSTKSLYLDVVTKNLNVDRSLFSLNDTFRFVTQAISSLFFGRLIAKFGAKKLMLAGIGAMTVSMVIYSMATHLFTIYLGGIVLGLGLSWNGTAMVSSIINKWVSRNRGTVTGAVLAANGLGGVIAINLLSPIIESGGENYRKAYLVSGLVVLCVGVLVLIFLREKPRDSAEQGAAPTKKKPKGTPWTGIPYEEAKRKPYFYVALICIFFTGFCLQGINGIAKAHMRDVGLAADYVTYAVSFSSLSLVVFKFLTGFLYDKLGLRVTMSVCSLTASVVIVLLALVTASPAGMVIAMIYSIFCALALPLETIMLPIYASDLFGNRSYDKILGIFVAVNVSGYAVGVPVVNACFDILGTYRPILFVSSGIMLLVTVTMTLVISQAHRVRMEVEQKEAVGRATA